MLELYNLLDKLSPFNTQASWDNSGLNVGSLESKLDSKKIYLALEADLKVASKIQEDSLLITHHPLIFSKLKCIDTSMHPGNVIKMLIQKNITLISMHTNFDLSHLNKAFALKLGFKDCSEKDYVLSKEVDMDFDTLALGLKERLGLEVLQVCKASTHITKVNITCGSGMSSLSACKANECLITGDIKYHDAVNALANKVSLINVPHYFSEEIFGEVLDLELRKFGIKAIIISSQNPLSYI
ncbi:Nif3-like dinuclear metal center hexameric protein [Helicobacter sp. 13S00401-1]|uniref:Nif3-like dinuclear metal center hexameric protein n=1 Tax=Helicobacter sp. 13S00401-1 TaxID=1905758 RepID=UPI000BA5EE5E|nr:Nif3-like dinuclear metal center hexameric protein [Helicobacter sp. 13S00401-1]PAF49676.1 Nif3-like dinuclear metal center hexameric protein [Helicobacter sp. 13S00401-1]